MDSVVALLGEEDAGTLQVRESVGCVEGMDSVAAPLKSCNPTAAGGWEKEGFQRGLVGPVTLPIT